MFIKSEHTICVQTSSTLGKVLVGLGSHKPYTHVQFELSEQEARDLAGALIVVADSAAQAVADTARLESAVAESMWEGAL